jgi:hypothetical protein
VAGPFVAAIAVSVASVVVLAARASPAAAAEEPPAAPGAAPSGRGSETTPWWFRLRSTAYIFQEEHPAGATLDRVGAYQGFDGAVLGLAGGRLALRASGRFADDLALAETVTERTRLTTGYLEARPGGGVTARLGRQFVQEGGTGLTLDGVMLRHAPSRSVDAVLWGGARAPFTHELDVGDFGDDGALGVRVGVRPAERIRVSGSWAYRERGGRVASRPMGLEASASPIAGLDLRGRAAYDLESEQWHRAEALARWRPPRCRAVLSAQVIDRSPDVDGASYFARFAGAERIRLARSSVRYERPDRFGGEVEYVGSFVDERTATRVGAAVLVPIGRLGYSVRFGDAGEEDRWYGDVAWAARPWLRVEGSASFATYALLEDAPEADERDLTSATIGVRATPRPGMDVTLEVQSLDNPGYSEDVRVLAGLDLTMGRGASRFGLDRGGWLP